MSKNTVNSSLPAKCILLTGGGTAGHVTPNIALLPHLVNEGFEIHYVGSKDGIERDLLANFDYVTYHAIPVGKLRRYFSIKNLTDPFRVLAGIFCSKRILKKVHPDVVFSKGGFVAVPVVIASKNIAPVISHESDYTPGLATKIVAKHAKKICVTFEDTARFIGEKAIHTGTPIRAELFEGNGLRGLEFLGFDGKKPVLLVMGGSLGAQAINVVLTEALPELLTRFDIAHICGPGKANPEISRRGYVQYEYLKDELPDVFAASDIILSRAGANAVFEFLALCKPALLVPLTMKTSRGDQILNANYFKAHGFADLLDQDEMTPRLLCDRLYNLYEQREQYMIAMHGDNARSGTENVLRVIFDTINGD